MIRSPHLGDSVYKMYDEKLIIISCAVVVDGKECVVEKLSPMADAEIEIC